MTGVSEPPIAARRLPGGMIMPPGVLPGGILLLLAFSYGPNFLYVLLSVAILIGGSSLLWRPGENPILLFVFAYQWLQASALVFLANARDETLDYIGKFGGQVDTATTLTLCGLIAFALGLFMGAGPRSPIRGAHAHKQAARQSLPRWFGLYLAAVVVSIVLQLGASVVPGLSQPLLALAALKWVFFFILAFAAMARKQALHPLFVLAFLGEFIAGVGGYFSDFKTVFFVTAMAAIAAGVRLSARATAGLGACVVILAMTSVVWTAVKEDYRNFVSGGEAAQIVTVGYGERVGKLSQLIEELTRHQLEDAAETLVRRVAYVEFFAAVLDQVPGLIPHADGSILKDAVARPFMPRIFFPNKSVIDDSERTNYYTGIGVAGADHGTSISLGWLAECYIDFGPWGMLVEALGIGALYGMIYRLFVDNPRIGPLMGGAMALGVLFFAAALESSLTKVIGAVAVNLLMAIFLVKYVLPQFCPWSLHSRPDPGAKLV